MSGGNPGRVAADFDGDFVVFLIGMRINKPLKIHKWLRRSALAGMATVQQTNGEQPRRRRHLARDLSRARRRVGVAEPAANASATSY
jgi:hypothetical protein